MKAGIIPLPAYSVLWPEHQIAADVPVLGHIPAGAAVDAKEMEEGTLLVKLIKPNKDVLQEIEISPLANVGWDQDLRWEKDEEKAGNFGSWTIVVSAKGASGRYNVSVRAN